MTTPSVPLTPDRDTPALVDVTARAARRAPAADESLRRALLTLHGELLEEQRRSAERFDGRMSAGEVLQAATVDLRFSWLGTLCALMAELDAILVAHRGRVYFAKDAFVNPALISAVYPRLEEFRRVQRDLDPSGTMRSLLSTRLKLHD